MTVPTGSIIANNLGDGNCTDTTIIDGGYNFADDDSCGAGFDPITPGADFDIVLADNGGPTQTHALFPGSVAIDAAGECGLAMDQRGYPRDDGACDSGSFEHGPMDSDGDGVPDPNDSCPDTIIPESVPTNHLGVNRWALVDDDNMFDTTPPPGGGGGPDFLFSVADTGGCSCEQLIDAWDLGQGHTKFGCSTGVMLQWTASFGGYDLGDPERALDQMTAGGFKALTQNDGSQDATTSGNHAGPEVQSKESAPPRRAPRQVGRRE